MTQLDEFRARIDRVLVFWHNHRPRMSVGRGYNSKGTIPYQAPCHWDSRNGAAEELAEVQQWVAINAVIDRIPDTPHRWRLAMTYEAQRLAVGVNVFTWERLPKDRDELDVLVLEARNLLAAGLMKAGLI